MHTNHRRPFHPLRKTQPGNRSGRRGAEWLADTRASWVPHMHSGPRSGRTKRRATKSTCIAFADLKTAGYHTPASRPEQHNCPVPWERNLLEGHTAPDS